MRQRRSADTLSPCITLHLSSTSAVILKQDFVISLPLSCTCPCCSLLPVITKSRFVNLSFHRFMKSFHFLLEISYFPFLLLLVIFSVHFHSLCGWPCNICIPYLPWQPAEATAGCRQIKQTAWLSDCIHTLVGCRKFAHINVRSRT